MKSWVTTVNAWRRLATGTLLLFVLLGAGAVGYMIIEGWSLLDGLYMTVTTVTTVGFREVQPLSTAGQIFTIFLILLGVGVALYILVGVVTLVIEGELGAAFGIQRMRARIQALRNHYILCGFGRVGEEIGREFKERRIPFVVIESNPEAIERAREREFPLIEGDASQDATLVEAGIAHARCLLAASDSDAGNTYITLTAKAMKPGILVVARAGQPQNQEKLLRAGADRVISPYLIGGRRMALSALQPLVADFLDTVVGRTGTGQHILAEVKADTETGFAGRRLDDILQGAGNTIALAIQKRDGRILVRPSLDITLSNDDRLIVLSSETDLEPMSRRATGQPAAPQGAQAAPPKTTRRVEI